MMCNIKLDTYEETKAVIAEWERITREEPRFWGACFRTSEVANNILEKYKHIAEEDIVCYKKLCTFRQYYRNPVDVESFFQKVLFFFKSRGKLISPYRKFLYRTNGLYNSDVPIRPDFIYIDNRDTPEEGYICLGKGIHAYASYKSNGPFNKKYGFFYKCIIPKGTVYYIGEDDRLVAERMFITDEIVK